MKKMVKLLLAGLMVALALSGCVGNSSTGGSNDPKPSTDTAGGPPKGVAQERLLMNLRGDPQSFNPDMKSDDYAWYPNQNIFNRLVKLNSADQVIPDLAKSWEFSDDGLVLTFHLQENVKWHDGEEFSSEDVKWTFETMIANKWSKSDSLSSVSTIECPDKNTVVLNLKNPDVSIISKLGWYATFIMPKHIWDNPNYADFVSNPATWQPIGTGPYKLQEYKAGVSVVLTRNDDFWGDKAIIKELVYQIIPDETTAYQTFLNGELDYFNGTVPTVNKHDLDNDPNYTIETFLSINRTYLTFNMEKGVFTDPNLRKAVAMGVDRKGVYDRVANKTGALSEYYLSPVWDGTYLDKNYKLPERNIEEAKKLIEAAGYTMGADGFYMTVTLDMFESGSFKDIGQIVKENLKEIGINVTLNVMEMAAWQDKVQQNHNFDMTMLAGYQGPDVSGVAGRVASYGGTNIGMYNNPEVDKNLEEASKISDVAERAKYYSEVQRIMSEDMPMVFLLDNGDKLPIKSYLEGTPRQVQDKAASLEFTYAYFTK